MNFLKAKKRISLKLMKNTINFSKELTPLTVMTSLKRFLLFLFYIYRAKGKDEHVGEKEN